MEKFNELMKRNAGDFWLQDFPEALTKEEKLYIEEFLDTVFKQGNGSCMIALLDYLRAIKLVRTYPLKEIDQPQNDGCPIRLQAE